MAYLIVVTLFGEQLTPSLAKGSVDSALVHVLIVGCIADTSLSSIRALRCAAFASGPPQEHTLLDTA